MATGPTDARMALWRRKSLWVGALVVVIAPLAWFSLPSRTHFYTDAETIREPLDVTRPRDILWQPPRVVDFGFSVGEDLYEPRLSADGLTLYFVRGKAGNADSGSADIVFSRRAYEGWSPPQPLHGVNSDADDLGPELSADGTTLYFYSNRAGGQGGYDLWVARRDDELAEFSAPENLGPAVNSAYNEYGPAVSADGRTLYFASNRPRVTDAPVPDAQAWTATIREDLFKRTYDLYIVARDDSGGATATALTLLNTDANEGAPAVSPSGDFLYFTSDRVGGAGGFDLYRARRLRGSLTDVINLGPAINTPANELDPAVSLGGFALHFSSDRREADGAAPPPYRLFQSTSREVFVDSVMQRAAIDWGAVCSALGPNLLWALLALLMLLLLLATLRAARDRRLSLLARCLLTSLALHALLMLLFTAWQVTAALTGLGGRKGEIRVALSGEQGGGLQAQIYGSVSAMSDTPALKAAIDPMVTQLPVEMTISMASSAVAVEVSPQVIVPVAPLSHLASVAQEADARLVSTTRHLQLDSGGAPRRMVDLATPMEVKREDQAESAGETHPALVATNRLAAMPSVPLQTSGRMTEIQTLPGKTTLNLANSSAGGGQLTSFVDAPAAMNPKVVSVPTAAIGISKNVLPSLSPPSGGSAMAETETAGQMPQLAATTGRQAAQAAQMPLLAPATIMEIAPESGGGGAGPAATNWRDSPQDAPASALTSASRSLSESVLKASAPMDLPDAAMRWESAPPVTRAGASEEERNALELPSALWTTGQRQESTLPLPRAQTVTDTNVALPCSSYPAGLAVQDFDSVARDANPAGVAVKAFPLAFQAKSAPPSARPIDLPLAFDLPVEAPPEPAAEAEAPHRAGHIQGRVLSVRTGEPIAGAEIRLDVDATAPVTVLSDGRGRYSLVVPTELPEFFALSAMAEGYMPASANVTSQRLTSDGVRVNFRLRPVTSESIAIEAVPDVHHLGDNRFAGQINSQFQKRSEGRRFSATFMVSAAQLHECAEMVELRLLAKGVQTRHRLLINGQSLPARLDAAPDDGSFGEFDTRFSRELLTEGENSFEIHAGSIGNDVDDFEFVNVQIHLKP